MFDSLNAIVVLDFEVLVLNLKWKSIVNSKKFKERIKSSDYDKIKYLFLSFETGSFSILDIDSLFETEAVENLKSVS